MKITETDLTFVADWEWEYEPGQRLGLYAANAKNLSAPAPCEGTVVLVELHDGEPPSVASDSVLEELQRVTVRIDAGTPKLSHRQAVVLSSGTMNPKPLQALGPPVTSDMPVENAPKPMVRPVELPGYGLLDLADLGRLTWIDGDVTGASAPTLFKLLNCIAKVVPVVVLDPLGLGSGVYRSGEPIAMSAIGPSAPLNLMEYGAHRFIEDVLVQVPGPLQGEAARLLAAQIPQAARFVPFDAIAASQQWPDTSVKNVLLHALAQVERLGVFANQQEHCFSIEAIAANAFENSCVALVQLSSLPSPWVSHSYDMLLLQAQQVLPPEAIVVTIYPSGYLPQWEQRLAQWGAQAPSLMVLPMEGVPGQGGMSHLRAQASHRIQCFSDGRISLAGSSTGQETHWITFELSRRSAESGTAKFVMVRPADPTQEVSDALSPPAQNTESIHDFNPWPQDELRESQGAEGVPSREEGDSEEIRIPDRFIIPFDRGDEAFYPQRKRVIQGAEDLGQPLTLENLLNSEAQASPEGNEQGPSATATSPLAPPETPGNMPSPPSQPLTAPMPAPPSPVIPQISSGPASSKMIKNELWGVEPDSPLESLLLEGLPPAHLSFNPWPEKASTSNKPRTSSKSKEMELPALEPMDESQLAEASIPWEDLPVLPYFDDELLEDEVQALGTGFESIGPPTPIDAIPPIPEVGVAPNEAMNWQEPVLEGDVLGVSPVDIPSQPYLQDVSHASIVDLASADHGQGSRVLQEPTDAPEFGLANQEKPVTLPRLPNQKPRSAAEFHELFAQVADPYREDPMAEGYDGVKMVEAPNATPIEPPVSQVEHPKPDKSPQDLTLRDLIHHSVGRVPPGAFRTFQGSPELPTSDDVMFYGPSASDDSIGAGQTMASMAHGASFPPSAEAETAFSEDEFDFEFSLDSDETSLGNAKVAFPGEEFQGDAEEFLFPVEPLETQPEFPSPLEEGSLVPEDRDSGEAFDHGVQVDAPLGSDPLDPFSDDEFEFDFPDIGGDPIPMSSVSPSLDEGVATEGLVENEWDFDLTPADEPFIPEEFEDPTPYGHGVLDGNDKNELEPPYDMFGPSFDEGPSVSRRDPNAPPLHLGESHPVMEAQGEIQSLYGGDVEGPDVSYDFPVFDSSHLDDIEELEDPTRPVPSASAPPPENLGYESSLSGGYLTDFSPPGETSPSVSETPPWLAEEPSLEDSSWEEPSWEGPSWQELEPPTRSSESDMAGTSSYLEEASTGSESLGVTHFEVAPQALAPTNTPISEPSVSVQEASPSEGFQTLSPSIPSSIPSSSPSESGHDSVSVGDWVSHPKYGMGQIQKITPLQGRTIWNIHFQSVGKRLMDPQLTPLTKSSPPHMP